MIVFLQTQKLGLVIYHTSCWLTVSVYALQLFIYKIAFFSINGGDEKLHHVWCYIIILAKALRGRRRSTTVPRIFICIVTDPFNTHLYRDPVFFINNFIKQFSYTRKRTFPYLPTYSIGPMFSYWSV